jgi:hypothetical protein
MRNLAYIILIPAALIMVLATALGFDFVSAYTVKKALPRFIIAAIFMAISYPLLDFFVQLTNVVGLGINGLISSAFGHSEPITLSTLFGAGDVSGVEGFAFSTILTLGVTWWRSCSICARWTRCYIHVCPYFPLGYHDGSIFTRTPTNAYYCIHNCSAHCHSSLDIPSQHQALGFMEGFFHKATPFISVNHASDFSREGFCKGCLGCK